MTDREANRLYRRFREQGDVAALGALFDHTAPELFRVASHLVRDLHAAEDLVQETFLAAIRGRETFDAERGVKPWLFGILARQAALHHRQRARRSAGEATDAQPARDEGPSRVASEHEWMVELERAVRELPPLYRDVVERHLRHGQGSQEIAQALDRAPGTVRVQIHRGLDMLRKALPAGFAASGALDAGQSRGIEAVREAVLAHAARSPAVLSAAASGSGAMLSAAAGLKLAAALAIGVVVWIAATPTESIPIEPSSVAAIVEASAPSLYEPTASAGTSERASGALPAAVDAPSASAANLTVAMPGWVLRGSVACGTPTALETTQITVRPIGGPTAWPPDLAVATRCDREGRFACDLTPLFVSNPRSDPQPKPSELVVRADHEACAPSEVRVDVPQVQRDRPSQGHDPWLFETRLELVRAAAVIGRVVGEHGDPIADADVALLGMASGELDETPLDFVRSAYDGSFRLRTANTGACVVVAVRDSMQPVARAVTVEHGAGGEPIRLELSRGAHIAGRVEPRGIQIRSGVKLSASRSSRAKKYFRVGSHGICWDGGESFSHHRVHATSAADGTFALVGLSAGMHTLLCASGPGDYVLAQEPIEVEAPAEDVVFSSSWSRIVFAVECDGAPVPRAVIHIHWRQGSHPLALHVDANGRLPILVEGGKPYHLDVRAEGYSPATLDIVAPPLGGESVQPIVLARASAEMTIELVEKGGSRFTRAGVAFSLLDEPEEIAAAGPGMRWWPRSQLTWPDIQRDVTVDDGVLVLQNLPLGLFEVRIEPDTAFGKLDSPWFHEPLVVELVSGSNVSRRVELVPAGRIRITLLGTDGEPRQSYFRLNDATGQRVPVHFFTRLADGSSFNHIWGLGDTGQRAPALSDPALPPGDYTLVLEPRGRPKQEHPIRVAGGEITTLDVVLRDE